MTLSTRTDSFGEESSCTARWRSPSACCSFTNSMKMPLAMSASATRIGASPAMSRVTTCSKKLATAAGSSTVRSGRRMDGNSPQR